MVAELDLGISSFVFWDDNPVERDKMKVMAPEVMTVDVPDEVYEWPNLIKKLYAFAKFNTTDDDGKKTDFYHRRRKFVEDSSDSTDEITYLKSINLSPTAHRIDQSNIQRAAQLCVKTNQFNLRSIRHSTSTIMSMNDKNPDLCFLVSLEDNYGSHGVVGLVCMEKINNEKIFLNTFLMSCRVLGRHLDTWMLKEALTRCKTQGAKNLIGGFIPTERNIVAKSFLLDHGFSFINKILSDEEAKIFGSMQKNEEVYSLPTSIINLPYEEIYA